MKELFEAYLHNSLSLSAVALLIVVFSPLLSRRYSAKCRYYLWVVIFAALLLPIRPQINVTLPEFLQSIPSADTAGVPAILPSGTPTSDTIQISNATNTRDWLPYALLLWGFVIACFLGWHIFQHLRFLTAVRRWSENIEDTVILELFTRTKVALGIQDNIILKSCACIKTPMLVGLLRPMVLLPQSCLYQDELPFILKHELVHYKRKDLWYKVLIMLVSSIHWFNPVVHLMVKSVLNLCEISCDEEVLKEIDAKGRAEYGEAIINVIRNAGAYQTALSTNFYSSTKGIKQRIYAMMDMTRKRFSPVLFFALLILTLCGTTTFALSSAQAKDKESGMSGIKIQLPQEASASDTNRSASAKSEINNNNLSSNAVLPENNIVNSGITPKYIIVSQEAKRILHKNVFSSLTGFYCYDENGGVIMTSEMVELLKNAH